MKTPASFIRTGSLLTVMLLVSACSNVQIPGFGSREPEPAPAETAQVTEPPLITSLDWAPNYSQPIRYLEAQLREQTDDRAMGQTITNIAYLYDAQLYVLFDEFLDYLPDAARIKEIDEQNRWLDTRQEAVSEAFNRNGGGEVGSYHAADMFIAQTRQRMSLIEQRLAGVKIE
ncbi:DUF1311 domain-containing protein [Nitrincola iocasae]|jgi:uncharacterized protein YecT (DUF1311 family)|uniref:DUF1311 domain-containing protein n=1 Tax=Nitrincola iocasae TaxID=2614693 RepID=A0A5J6LA72_9GAMM|nr:DUF1311 domain-containing protein [Nitrincola iocasae]QEW05172.1 DUF1311 domain-containing protein [Nitrincola iocasae]